MSVVHEPHVALVAMLRTLQHENLQQRLAANGVTSEHLTFREAQRSDLLRFDGALVVITVGGHTAINAVRQRCDDAGRPYFMVDHKASSWPMDRIRALPMIRTLNAARQDPPTPPLSAEEAHQVLSKGDISSFGACLRAARKSNDLSLGTLAELLGFSSDRARTTLLNEWETDRSSPNPMQHALLLELFPALNFAPLPTWPTTVADDGLEGDEWVTASLTIARPSSPEPEVPMPPPAPQLDKSDVIKLATLTATARSTLPDGVRDLLLTAKRLSFTLQDVLDLLAIQEHS
jgi:DNA-binding transcriptional regulator YiaG